MLGLIDNLKPSLNPGDTGSKILLPRMVSIHLIPSQISLPPRVWVDPGEKSQGNMPFGLQRSLVIFPVLDMVLNKKKIFSSTNIRVTYYFKV
jgi:hypothetical protein